MIDRKIVHIDMDAFYASVEQRDAPGLRGRPVIVAWPSPRSVVCAASYEARRFGVQSAMPAVRAQRSCPDGIFVPPDFARYKSVSRRVREIFRRYTEVIEPISLDEAYLDVTSPKVQVPSATEIAKRIRAAIKTELRLTASAGVAPNKFLAKIASDWRKPDGLMVIAPNRVNQFLETLPVAKIPGVGKVTQRRLAAINVKTVGQLKQISATRLTGLFGQFGRRLFELARGQDDEPVRTLQPPIQVSTETTFEQDLRLDQLEDHIRNLAEKTWAAAQRQQERVARTVVLKLKTSDFEILTRRWTTTVSPSNARELADVAWGLRHRVKRSCQARYRLVGVGLCGFIKRNEVHTQKDLFGLGGG